MPYIVFKLIENSAYFDAIRRWAAPNMRTFKKLAILSTPSSRTEHPTATKCSHSLNRWGY